MSKVHSVDHVDLYARPLLVLIVVIGGEESIDTTLYVRSEGKDEEMAACGYWW